MRRSQAKPISLVPLEVDSPIPLVRQLYEALRNAILHGQLKAGTQLPSTRALAADLSLSRNTVMGAFDQLFAEGYIEAKRGAGTYVSQMLPDDLLTPEPGQNTTLTPSQPCIISRAAQLLVTFHPYSPAFNVRGPHPIRPFLAGVPALDAFPHRLWERLLQKRWRSFLPASLGDYGAPSFRPLREAIAGYLAMARGVRCTWEQVLIVPGSQQGLALAAQVLLNEGDAVWIEDPGYLGARGALLSVGAHLVPVPVDGEGLDVQAGRVRAPDARLAFITPSHQFPLGSTMSLSRRLQLLEWARQAGAWILEDDYDSEFRYEGRPLPALQGLDTEGRTIYCGTFSKVLFPALRLGYLVVPSALADTFAKVGLWTHTQTPLLEQAVVADFLVEGHFQRHIRRMRALYAERQTVLVEALAKAGNTLTVKPSAAGLHLLGWLPEGTDDRIVARIAAKQGVLVSPLSQFALKPVSHGALMIGYAAFNDQEIIAGANDLIRALPPPRT